MSAPNSAARNAIPLAVDFEERVGGRDTAVFHWAGGIPRGREISKKSF